ncbi:MAG TPA: NAD(P)H-dependent glycerol-3-phosphate dehydrogenase [Bauldia sp.]|nr:NAD(P)H-dependent glycerol-3-phosphate dehydrogenase [Bauldia sp.]
MRDDPMVSIVGGGAWGTALALTAARAGRRVMLYARDPATVAAINERQENVTRLPGVKLAGPITATSDPLAIVATDIIIIAIPAQQVRATLTTFAPHLIAGTPVVIAAKGLERGTDKRLSEVVAEVAPLGEPAVLSGPSFASDVARGLPTAVTIAAADEGLALDLCHALSTPAFRPYAETDIIGVEIGGAVKNVLAIAAGIVAGRKLGASASAALVARGFAELRRLAEVLGARPETLMGLSGLGDLTLTCSGAQSRNFSFGFHLGSSGDPAAPHPLAEGIATAAVARDLARHHAILMPIVEAVAAIIDGDLSIDAAIEGLMTRPIKREAG